MYVCVFVPRWIGISAVTAKKKKKSIVTFWGYLACPQGKENSLFFFNKNCSLTITNKKKKIKLNK